MIIFIILIMSGIIQECNMLNENFQQISTKVIPNFTDMFRSWDNFVACIQYCQFVVHYNLHFVPPQEMMTSQNNWVKQFYLIIYSSSLFWHDLWVTSCGWTKKEFAFTNSHYISYFSQYKKIYQSNGVLSDNNDKYTPVSPRASLSMVFTEAAVYWSRGE